MAKKEKETYVEMNGILGNAYDYHVYHMKKTDFLISWALGFGVAFIVVMAFFGNMIMALAGGIIAALLVPKYYQRFRRDRRIRNLREQFKDLLESLSASYSAGRNTPDAFQDAMNDLMSIYGGEGDIIRELELICAGLRNNINIENLLLDFAMRSGLDDVMSFANVFEVCNRQGGDLKRVVNETRDVISDKMEIEMEIETMIAGNKNELNIMMIMPVIIVVMLKGLGTGTVNANTLPNIIIKLVCIGIFLLAYAMGRKIVDIKI
ncbi:MAG: type II secretion system F family protein [Clostridiales bacterium]|nr:type II secretion system F family protein [Clostridiales bacterium]